MNPRTSGEPRSDPDSQPRSSNANLSEFIHTLQACFDDLAKKNELQMNKLQGAVEALQHKPPTLDKKTKFWKLYSTLADEHDKEFLQSYSTDLDASLIFAGLFSAVSSAFIIQIQPEIQLPGVPLIVLVAQSLLYVSLFSTLLAALLAVLGKQWLMYYSAAGERGTIEARGLERQRKLDGLRRWKFDTVMQMFPLLLQIGLFLFSAALSIYLWQIHVSLAIVVLCFTSFGFTSYTFLLISAAVSPDCPFQTPLAPLLARILSNPLLMKLWGVLYQASAQPGFFFRRLYSAWISDTNVHLPRYRGRNPLQHEPAPLFTVPFPEPSAEITAVSWVLETSTDPRMLGIAADMAIDLQWPSGVTLGPSIKRLRESLLACLRFVKLPGFGGPGIIHVSAIQDGMALPVVQLGRAYCTLQCAAHNPQKLAPEPEYVPWLSETQGFVEPELDNVLQVLAGKPKLLLNPSASLATNWALHVIPSLRYADLKSKRESLDIFLKHFEEQIPDLDGSAFTDYLFCVSDFLSPVHSRDMAWQDKSQFQFELFQHLLTIISSELQNNKSRQETSKPSRPVVQRISLKTAARIVTVTGRLASNVTDRIRRPSERNFVVYQFCSSLPQSPGWIDVVLATGLFTDRCINGRPDPRLRDSSWVFKALDLVQDDHWDNSTVAGVAGLLHALLVHDTAPTRRHISLLIRALSMSGDISTNSARVLMQENIAVWFQDAELRPVLQKANIWSSLTRAALVPGNMALTERYIRTGYTLASIPDWHPYIHGELCAWITLFFRAGKWEQGEEYASVLDAVWGPEVGEYRFVDQGEKVWGLSFAALTNAWQNFDFTVSGNIHEATSLLRCTSWTVLSTSYHNIGDDDWRVITSPFQDTFGVPLRTALIQAAVGARRNISTTFSPLSEICDILEDLARKMPSANDLVEEDRSHWKSLREEFDRIIGTLD